MLMSSYFMASAAEGPGPAGLCWGIPKGPCQAEAGGRVWLLHPDHVPGAQLLVSWKRAGPSALVLGASPVCKVAAMSSITVLDTTGI